VRLTFIQLVDGAPVGQGDLPVTIPLSLGLSASVCVGSDTGAPVITDDKSPFAFTGTVKKALVDVTGEAVEDMAAKMKMYLVRQWHLERGRVRARSVYTS
jgi:arylsulfatase